jgi:hypothetical protein
MGVICAVGTAVWRGIQTFFSLAAVKALAAILQVYDIMSKITVGAVSLVMGMFTGILSAAGIISNLQAVSVLSDLDLLNTISVEVWADVYGALSTVSTVFKSVLDIIHFKTLMKIHDIAMLVSENYRKTMFDVMSSLVDVSIALKQSGGFLPLVLNNAKSVCLDVSSAMGRSFDIGELSYVQHLMEWANNFQHVATYFAGRPYDIISNVEYYITKPEIDNKATIFQTLFLSVDKTLDAAENMALYVGQLRDDLNRFGGQLPGFVKDAIQPYIKQATGALDEFINTTYKPALQQLQDITNILHGDLSVEKGKLETLAKRLVKPANYLKEIDTLPDDQRIEQEQAIGEIATRSLFRYVPGQKSNLDDIKAVLDGIETVVEMEIKPPSWEVTQGEIEKIEDTIPVEGRNTPFVGDY